MRRLNCAWLHALCLIVVGATACVGGQTGSESKETPGLGKTEPCSPLAEPDIRVEYVARTQDGELLVVIVPEIDFSYDEFRLFYGAEGRLLERTLDEVIRRRDGGTTNLLFTLDGEPADAFFPVEFADEMFRPGPATLTVDGTTADLERLDPEADAGLVEAAIFSCLAD